MRLQTNFVAPVGTLVLPLSLLIWSTVLFFSVWGMLLLVDAAAMSEEKVKLRDQLHSLGERHRQAPAPESLPPAADMHALRQRVAEINRLIGGPRQDINQLFSVLEMVMPDQVVLIGARYRRQEAGLEIVAESKDSGALTEFLKALEREAMFKAAMLNKQSVIQDSKGEKLVRFEISLQENTP